MLYKFLLLLFLLTSFTSCFEDTYQATKNVSLYYRDIGSNDGYTTYMDMVVLTNYHNKSETFKQLYEIAKNYVDTVKADFPVSAVTLIGQSPSGYLPKPNDDYWDEQQSYAIISFGFDNGFKENKDKKNVELNMFFIYKNSTPYPNLLPPGTLDSCMKSTTPIDSGF